MVDSGGCGVRVNRSRAADVRASLLDFADAAIPYGPIDPRLSTWARLARHGGILGLVPHVYILSPQADGLDFAKIGWSTGTTSARIASLQTGFPVPLVARFTYPGSRQLERAMHDRFARLRMSGEWFAIDGDLLWFLGLSARHVADDLARRPS